MRLFLSKTSQFVGVEDFQPLRSKGSISSMGSKGWKYLPNKQLHFCLLFIV